MYAFYISVENLFRFCESYGSVLRLIVFFFIGDVYSIMLLQENFYGNDYEVKYFILQQNFCIRTDSLFLDWIHCWLKNIIRAFMCVASLAWTWYFIIFISVKRAKKSVWVGVFFSTDSCEQKGPKFRNKCCQKNTHCQ